MADITVTELKALLDAGSKPTLLDVREPYEVATGNIGGLTIPMGEVPQHLAELEEYKNQELIVYCKSGGRSGSITAFLKQAGFTNVRNLKGGMLAWKAEIDPSLNV